MFRRSFPVLSFAVMTFALVLVASSASAQDAAAPRPRDAGSVSQELGTVSTTPEMWFYQQERQRYDDPKMAVRRKAEQRGAQRADRLAASKWYGMDNSRPVVNPTAILTSYSAYWGSNTYDPMRWRPFSVPYVVSRSGDGRY